MKILIDSRILSLFFLTTLFVVSESRRYFKHMSVRNLNKTTTNVPGNSNRFFSHFNLENRTISTVNPEEVYTDLYVFQITSNASEIKSFTEKEGLDFIRKVFEDGNYYLFRRHSDSCKNKRSRRNADGFMQRITRRSSIKWASQQISFERVHRSIRIEEPFEGDIYRAPLLSSYKEKSFLAASLDFDDPLFPEQWYLVNEGQLPGSHPGHDLNVLPAWLTGVTGKGIRIAVLDDGVDPSSEEVALNYDPILSGDYSYLSSEPLPVKENSHGTYCAAIAAGVANNNVCGVGVAFHANIGGVRLLNGDVTDVQEAMALVHALDHVDIYTASWGPKDDGKHIAGPGPLAKMAFHKGITQGRGGKGVIYVWAAGNGGRRGDNCNLDGYASSPYTLTVGALAADGRSAYYSEPCAALLAGVYVGGSHRPPADVHKERRKIKVIVPEGKGKCRSTFQGTSAAAPMAAGALSLVLQANPELTWRDVQHLIVLTSLPPAVEGGWGVNGVGRRFHPKVGFGALDAGAMVKAARGWRPVGPLLEWTSPPLTERRLVPNDGHLQISLSVPPRPGGIARLETATVTLTLRHPRFGRTSLTLRSPSGTLSVLLTPRAADDRNDGVSGWDFLSLHFWGEDPEGTWTLLVGSGEGAGVVEEVSIRLRGTS